MIDIDSRIRKQVYELSPQDFTDHPIWSFCLDELNTEGQDEATVRPTDKTELSGELPGSHVVAAKVFFADGSTTSGYLYNCDDNNIGCVQPNLFAGQLQVNLWLGWLRFLPNAAERVDAHYKTIGKSKEAIFPIKFQSTAAVAGSPLEVELQGFMALGLDAKVQILT